MTVSILTLVAILAGFLIRLYWTRKEASETPETKLQNTREEIEQEILSNDSDAATLRIDDVLRRLRIKRAQRQSDKPGSGNNPTGN